MKRLLIAVFSVFLFACNSLIVFGQNNIRGVGIIEVTSEFITVRDVTRTHRTANTRGGIEGGGVTGQRGGTEHYTVREQVREDRNLPFVVLRGDTEVFRGRTPVRVTNFDTGVTYTIIWNNASGRQQRGTFVIANTRPFIRSIHIE